MVIPRSLRSAFRAPAVGIPIAGLLGIATVHATAQETTPAATQAATQPATQESAGHRTFAVVPTFSVLETYTNNRFLTSSDRHSSLITQVSPGFQVTSHSGRVQGELDYSLNGYVYSGGGSGSNNLQNYLNASLKAEAVENWAYIDARANINQQSISAFGTQTPDPSLRNANQSETSVYSVSPYVRGSFSGLASYVARVGYQVTRSDGFSAANTKTSDGSLNLRSEPSSSSRLGWALALTHENIAFEQGRSTRNDRADATLNYSATPELVLSLSGGREANNITTLDTQSTPTWGVGLDWRPSERTHISLERDKRYFGNSHAASFEFRTPRTVWRYLDSQDASSSSGTATGSTQTAYDLLFTQFASIQPDPILRAQLVAAALAATGIGRGTLVGGGFLSSSVSLQRRRELSVALNGLRTTILLSAYQTSTSSLDPLAQATDDLSTLGTVRQRGAGATVSHRLTPQSSANATFSLLKSSASGSTLATNQRITILTWTTRLGVHVDLALSARYTSFGSTTSPYNESALIAGLIFRL